LRARNKSSEATDVTLHGVLAVVRLLARDAAREALVHHNNNRPAARELAVPTHAEEQSNVADR